MFYNPVLNSPFLVSIFQLKATIIIRGLLKPSKQKMHESISQNFFDNTKVKMVSKTCGEDADSPVPENVENREGDSSVPPSSEDQAVPQMPGTFDIYLIFSI